MAGKDLTQEQEDEERDWLTSVRRVMDRDAPRALLEQRTLHHGAVALRQRISTRYAFAPRALLGLARMANIGVTRMEMLYVMLVQRGYPVDVSLLLYRNLRLMFPDFTTAQGVWQLMAKEQLEKELGYFYGGLVATTLADPTSNPVLYALLMCHPGNEIPLSFGVAVAQVSIDRSDAQRGDWRSHAYSLERLDGINEGERVEARLGPEYPVTGRDYIKADNIYASMTGRRLLPYVCIDPREYDYEEITEKVREAHCPESLFGAGAPVGARPVFMRRRQDGDGSVTG